MPTQSDFVLVVDTSEKQQHNSEYTFDDLGITSVRASLDTGDYSILGYEKRFFVERKQIDDLFKTIVSERERFEAEMQRAKSFDYGAILIEATLEEVLTYRYPKKALENMLKRRTQAQINADPRRVVNSLFSWSMRCGVVPLFVSKDRDLCRVVVASLAERFLLNVNLKSTLAREVPKVEEIGGAA